MFDATKLQSCLKNLIGWENHYDTNEIPALNPVLNESESGVFYQEIHPAMRLDLISQALPENRDLNEYLDNRVNTGIKLLADQIFTERKLNDFSRELIASGNVINGNGWTNDVILNEGRFVGIKIQNVSDEWLKVAINKVGFQFTQPQSNLKIYVYHSSDKKPIKIIDFTSQRGQVTQWLDKGIDLTFENYNTLGGYFIIGYYQDDLTGQAIQYKKLNFKTGYCQSCDGGVSSRNYKSIQKHVSLTPIYVPSSSLNSDRDLFDLDSSFSTMENNYGINLNISAKCDLTHFLCNNKSILKTALGLKVTHLILRDIKFSQQINRIEENLRNLIIRDLEGDKDTNYVNIVTQLNRAVKAIDIDTSHLSKVCLPCTKKNTVSYGVV